MKTKTNNTLFRDNARNFTKDIFLRAFDNLIHCRAYEVKGGLKIWVPVS